MTDEQIINALKKYIECAEGTQIARDVGGTLVISLLQNALDLINRQQAEIEDYRRNIKQLTETLTGGNGLRIRVDNMIVYADDLEEWLEFCDKQKAETIKELEAKIHKKLHEAEMHGNFEPIVTREMFDSVVKELVGEGK